MANTLKFGNGLWATKEDSVLAYNDENGNYKPLPFEFERDTNATVVNKNGLIETVGNNIPRIDFQGNNKGALLLEPERTNDFFYSENFSNSYWIKNGVTESIGYLAPDGTLNAYKLVANASDSSMYKVFDVTSGTTYSLSFYLKTVSGTLDTNIGLGSPGFPMNEGDGGRYKNITVTNEWKRYTLTSTADATASSGISFGGFGGFTPGEEVYIWGAQFEQGSYPTSYIPTQGGTVTRTEDICSNNWDGLDVTTESFSFYTEFNISAVNGVVVSKKQSLGATDGWALQLNSSGILKLYVFGDSTEKTAQSLNLSLNVNHKVVGIIDRVNDLLHLYVDGTLSQSTDISTITGTILSTYGLTLGSLGNETATSNINTNSFNYYNTALTDSEAIALTTI